MIENVISKYNGVLDTTGTQITIGAVLNAIKNGVYKKEIERLRNEPEKEKRSKLKSKLDGVTWSGTFEGRKITGLKVYSQVLCIDIDNLDLDTIEDVKKNICKNSFTFACFISPSGNGLKFLVKTNTIVSQHQHVFLFVQKLFAEAYNIEIDKSGKDVSRLCFLSYDANLYINEKCDIITDTVLLQKKKVIDEKKTIEKNTDEILLDIVKFTNNKETYTPGNRNNYIHLLACNANRKGINEIDTLFFCQNNFDLDFTEIKTTVKSAYTAHASEFNTDKFENKGKPPHKKQTKEKDTTDTDIFDDSVIFWYTVENVDKKTGEVKEEIKFSYDDAILFLQNNGFYLLDLGNHIYQFIYVKNKIIEIVNEVYIKKFILSFLKTSTNNEFKKVREMFRRGSKNYVSRGVLEGLDYYAPDFKKDTKDTAFVYFKNCFLEITATGILQKDYKNLNGNIWRKQVIDFDFKLQNDFATCDFSKFLQYAILGTNEENSEPIAQQKLKSITSTIGYLMHRYKNPSLTKAVISVDKKLRRTGEANGRSGKSLFSKALTKMLNICTIDGRNFDFRAAFPFQNVNIDTEMVNFNDIGKNFDFGRLFGMITEEFTFEKKGRDSITLSFEDAPKFYISTNYSLKGDGESNKGRQHIVEFSTYFNTEHTPVKEFGKMFFYEWNTDEWSKFYSFMLNCLVVYLKIGLIDFPLENYAANRFIDAYSLDMFEWLEENIQVNNLYVKDDLIKEIKSKFSKLDNAQKNYFTKLIKSFCECSDLEYNAHIVSEDKRDKRNNIDYITLTNKIKDTPA